MNDSNSSLALGLDAIFNITSQDKGGVKSPSSESVIIKNVSISVLRPSPYQPRVQFNEKDITELAASIATNGIIQPIIVRPVDQYYEIIAGERRFRAAKMAKLTELPVIIKDVPDDSVLAFALIENIQRKDLNIVEEARAYHRLLNDLELSHDDIANKVGKSRSHITNILRLLNLSENILSCLGSEIISMGHARALLGVSENMRERVLEIVIKKQLSVRDTEHLVKKTMLPSGELVNKKVSYFDPEVISSWQSSLSRTSSAKVSITISDYGKGKISFSVNSPNELELLIEKLSGLESVM